MLKGDEMRNIVNLFVLVSVLGIVLTACGPTQNEVAPVEEWPAIGTRQAAESTRVALIPTVEARGSVAVQIIAGSPDDALVQMKNALADNTGYETVSIMVVSGNTLVLTAIYDHNRSGSIEWGGDWTPSVFTMQGASSSWVGDARFWGE